MSRIAASMAAAALVATLAVLGATPALAQTAPPGYVPPDPTLFTTDTGFRLAWQPVTGAARYAIRLGVTDADTGLFIADDELANIDASARTFDIDPLLPHTEPNRCYTMRWRIYALIGTSAPEPPGEHSIRMCTDADNRSSFVDASQSAPAPPSDVHLERRGAAWVLVWRDNSGGAAAFKPGIVIVNPSGERVASVDLPQLPPNTRSIVLPQRLTSEAPPDSCYGAIFMVFALAPDGATTLPGNFATAVCNTGTLITFPDVGTGPSPAAHPHLALAAAYAFALAGAALIDIAMLRLWRRR